MKDGIPGWYREAFGERYLATAGDTLTQERTLIEVDFLVRQLELPTGAHLFDAACGHGRHAIEFAKRGYRVSGVDLSAEAIAQGMHTAREAQLTEEQVHLRQGDLRELTEEERFDGGYNFFSSFGYLESEEEDERSLRAIVKTLKIGAPFVLECMSIFWIAHTFRDSEERTFLSGHRVRCDRDWDLLSGRVSERYTYFDPDKSTHTLETTVRIYSPSEYRRLFDRVGLRAVRAVSSPDGTPVSVNSVRVAMVGTRVR